MRSGVNWMRENVRRQRLGERAHEHRLAEAGHALEQRVPAGEHAGETPSTTSRLPTIDLRDLRAQLVDALAEASRPARAPLRSRSCHLLALVAGLSLSLVARPNQLEVALHVEAVAAGDLVLGERLLGDLVVLGVDLLVAARREARARRRRGSPGCASRPGRCRRPAPACPRCPSSGSSRRPWTCGSWPVAPAVTRLPLALAAAAALPRPSPEPPLPSRASGSSRRSGRATHVSPPWPALALAVLPLPPWPCWPCPCPGPGPAGPALAARPAPGLAASARPAPAPAPCWPWPCCPPCPRAMRRSACSRTICPLPPWPCWRISSRSSSSFCFSCSFSSCVISCCCIRLMSSAPWSRSSARQRPGPSSGPRRPARARGRGGRADGPRSSAASSSRSRRSSSRSFFWRRLCSSSRRRRRAGLLPCA